MSLLELNCPKSCDCSNVTHPSGDHLQITCFIWDLGEFDFQSLFLVSEKYHLKLYCDSEVPIELTKDLFAFLNQMTSISLNNCKFSYVDEDVFRGLRYLTNVEILSATKLDLRIHPDAFKSLERLESLSLGGNGLRNLPNLCNFRYLKSLNISGNSLETLQDAGIACGVDNKMKLLTLLDISNNKITNIGEFENYGQAFPNLESLVVENNHVTLKSLDNPFIHFHELRILDLSGNKISFLPEGLLEKSSDLQELDLSQNQIENIPEQLLRRTDFLLRLDLKDNRLNDTTWSTMMSTNNLMYLDLSRNLFRMVNSSVIEELRELVYLNLAYNNILTIAPRTFQNQQRLRSLNLAGNDFHVIDDEAFYGLFVLAKLELQDNKLYSMSTNIFHSLTSLVSLNLSSNYLTELPSLTKLTSLLVLDANNNILGELRDTTFQGQKKIRDINLSKNKIAEITEMLFKPCESIENLDLSVNAIQYVHPAMFMELTVQRLLLHQNKIEDIGKTFANMKQMLELNLSHNSIRDILQRHMFPEGLELLDLSYNNIQHVRQRAFYGLSEIRMVDIGFNKIKSLSEDSLMVTNGPYSQSAFVIKGNPLVCDCNLLWLRNWVQSLKGPVIVDLNETVCSGAYDFPSSPIYLVPKDRFLCQYTTFCTRKCRCCDYEFCDCKYKCPSKCDCYQGADLSNIHYVQCSQRNLTQVDKFLPRTATRLDLSGNDIGTIRSHIFLGMHKLKWLYLNNSAIFLLENRSFIGLNNLLELRLQYNFLETLRKTMFEGLDSLLELYLDHNQISSIEPGVFDNIKGLKILRLSHNFLQHMDDYTSHLVFVYQDITLFSNPWACDCAMYFSAKHNPSAFVNMSDGILARSGRINCTVLSLNSTNKLTHLDEYQSICEGSGTTVNTRKFLESLQAGTVKVPYTSNRGGNNLNKTNDIEHDDVKSEILGLYIPEKHMKVFIPVMVGSCVIVLLVIIVLFKSGLTKFWFCAKYRCKSSDEDILYDKTRHYDAFIAYHPNDDTYVIRELVLRLERGDPKYQLLVQHRDFPNGSSMPHFIENGVRYSHRTVIVLSNDHIFDNTWLKYIIECVKHDSLRRLVLVILGKIDKSVVDPIIRSRMKSKYSLKSNDRFFWRNMKLSLPKPGKTERDNARAEVRPYASTDIGRLPVVRLENQAYEEPVSTLSRSMSSRPLPTITEYVTSSSSSYTYSAGSQNSSNIYEEIKENENTVAKIPANYEEPWKDSDLDEKFSTLSRESTQPLCNDYRTA